jgi:hypothetical protein
MVGIDLPGLDLGKAGEMNKKAVKQMSNSRIINPP